MFTGAVLAPIPHPQGSQPTAPEPGLRQLLPVSPLLRVQIAFIH